MKIVEKNILIVCHKVKPKRKYAESQTEWKLRKITMSDDDETPDLHLCAMSPQGITKARLRGKRDQEKKRIVRWWFESRQEK